MQSIKKSVKAFLILGAALLIVGAACRADAPVAQQNPVKAATANNQAPLAAARQSKIVSGEYDQLLLAVGANGELTGYYNDSTGAGQFTCIFYIRGKLQNDAAEITTWFPAEKDVIRGKLEFVEENGKPGVNIKLAEEPGGCWNVNSEFDDAEGSTLGLNEPREWNAIRVVKADKARFYDQPNNNSKRAAYLVTGDAVGVFKTQNDWAEAEFVNHCADKECNQTKITRGWLKETDFFSSAPPN